MTLLEAKQVCQNIEEVVVLKTEDGFIKENQVFTKNCLKNNFFAANYNVTSIVPFFKVSDYNREAKAALRLICIKKED